MMGRRCGALDPGVVLYLLRQKDMTAREFETLLYERSGLLGVSGISNDMAVLEASAAPEAREAIDMFCHRASDDLAALAAAIGGLDTLVFTAGIGKNSETIRNDPQRSATIRTGICKRLGWMGVALDPDTNKRNGLRIDSTTSRVDVLVIPTDEEAVIARATQGSLRATAETRPGPPVASGREGAL